MFDENGGYPAHNVGRGCCLLSEEEATGMFAGNPDKTSSDITFHEAKSHTASIRKPRASFSGFGRAVVDLRTFPKRVASQRRKSLVSPNYTIHDEPQYEFQKMPSADRQLSTESPVWIEEFYSHPQPRAPGWLRRCVSTTFRHRRRTSDNPSRPATAKWAQPDPSYPPIPITDVAPPTLLRDNSGGKAARAAAAAQNEMLDYIRKFRTQECNVRGDSESGVGIDTRCDESGTAIARRGRPREVRHSLMFTKLNDRPCPRAAKGVVYAHTFLPGCKLVNKFGACVPYDRHPEEGSPFANSTCRVVLFSCKRFPDVEKNVYR